MPTTDAADYLAFFRAVEPFKDTLRNSRTRAGRRESAAEHTWRLCLMVLALEDELAGIDAARLLKLLVVHDLGEVVRGDVPAPDQEGDKSADERADFVSLLAALPAPAAARLTALWDEYDAAVTPEARVAKALDKLETCMQHVEGAQPAGFDYAFNLGYGREWSAAHPLVAAMRALVDAETASRAASG